jgi:hypothetical protein
MRKDKVLFLTLSLFLVSTQPVASAQTPSAAHLAAVVTAQKSAYAITDATNNCPHPATDILGWPSALMRECVYKGGTKKGYVLLVDVKPEIIATWIETACAQLMPTASQCFERVLKCARGNSGMMFPVSGNMMENMGNGPWTNWFFRNGMTVRMQNQQNNTTAQIPVDRQKELALMSDANIIRIPSGLTRFWRTTPAQFAARFPNEGVPESLNTPQARQKWLDIARAEFLGALTKPNNRLLEAWIAAHKQTLAAGSCGD